MRDIFEEVEVRQILSRGFRHLTGTGMAEASLGCGGQAGQGCGEDGDWACCIVAGARTDS